MARPELGEKRICPECDTKYYDLNKDPIICPKCGAAFTQHEEDKAQPEKTDETAAKPADDEEEDLWPADSDVAPGVLAVEEM